MQRIYHLLRRAATARPEEWSFRLRQAIYAGQQRWRTALRVPSGDGHLRALRIRRDELSAWWSARRSTWFLEGDARKRVCQSAQTDDDVRWALNQADIVMGGRFPLFAYPPIAFTADDRWHRDAILERTAPKQIYNRVPYLDVHRVGDSKHVWEPNRFGWTYWLGIAHAITGDNRYADRFTEWTHDWFTQNPYPWGINYASALEIALRNYAWIWSLQLFPQQYAEDPELLDRVLRGIWLGCRHIQANLSTYFSPNTHLLGEAFSLYATGAALPDFAPAARWRQQAETILLREAKRQFHADGTHRELSTGYQLYSTDFYLQACLIAKQTGFVLSPAMFSAAHGLSARVAELVTPDLELPAMNDNDSGALIPLAANPLDARPSLAAAKLLGFRLPVVSERPWGYARIMQLGQPATERGRRQRPAPPLGRNSAPLWDSGIVAHRNARGDYLAFRSSPFGLDDCPHSHDAPLSVIVHLARRPVFVDSGTHSYTQSPGIREQFRSAAGKNTLLWEGSGPSIPAGFFSWEQTHDCQLRRVERFTDGVRVVGEHTGFSARCGFHVRVRREVILLDLGIIAIRDTWDADQPITLESAFTLHPDVRVDAAHNLLHHPGDDDWQCHFVGLGTDGNTSLTPQLTTHPYSAHYGHETTTEQLRFTQRGARGSMLCVWSQAGRVAWQQAALTFADAPCIRLEITPSRLTPQMVQVPTATPNHSPPTV